MKEGRKEKEGAGNNDAVKQGKQSIFLNKLLQSVINDCKSQAINLKNGTVMTVIQGGEADKVSLSEVDEELLKALASISLVDGNS
jgi:hypothetical protein